MTARSDVCVYLDAVPRVDVHASTPRSAGDAPRAALAIDAVLTIFAPADVLRATLVDALAQLDAMETDG